MKCVFLQDQLQQKQHTNVSSQWCKMNKKVIAHQYCYVCLFAAVVFNRGKNFVILGKILFSCKIIFVFT